MAVATYTDVYFEFLSVGEEHRQRMRTKCGSCNAKSRSIRLNTGLEEKPRECIEYIVVHELVHLLEATHNPRFVELMDQAMPNWRAIRERLNRLPVRQEDWSY